MLCDRETSADTKKKTTSVTGTNDMQNTVIVLYCNETQNRKNKIELVSVCVPTKSIIFYPVHHVLRIVVIDVCESFIFDNFKLHF